MENEAWGLLSLPTVHPVGWVEYGYGKRSTTWVDVNHHKTLESETSPCSSMAVFRTLIRSLLRNPNARSNPSHCSTFPFPLAAFSCYPLSTPAAAAAGAPNSFSGPLFLSCPPWKLSQSATPFYLRGEDAIFPKDLLGVRSFPAGLGLRSLGEIERGFADVIGGLRREGTVGRELRTVRVDEKFLNFPNLVSISRMVSGPLIGWMILQEWYLPAFGALAVSGATDWLDGFLARRMGINSVIGSYLDPLADKVLISCVAVAMVKKDLLSPMLVALVVFRDVGLVAGAVHKRASSLGWKWKSWSEFVNLDAAHREKVEPLFISKVNTVFQLLLVAAALLQPELGTDETQEYITFLSWLVASTTTASALAYGVKHLRR